MYVVILVAGILVALGIMVKYFKWYWLISGINMMPDPKKENVDKEGLGNFVGNMMLVMALLILTMAFLNEIEKTLGFIISFGVLFVFTIFLVVKAQTYDKNPKTGGEKLLITLVVGLLLVFCIGSVSMMIYGIQEPGVTITENSLRITGMYGYSEPLNRIESISLVDLIPPRGRKSSGFNAGAVIKGNYQIEGMGFGLVYLQSKEGPFIVIDTKTKFIIMNFKDQEKTKMLYNQLKQSM
jgi:hypothetical protein